MPCCCSTAPGGTRPASSTCPPISPRSSCRREPRNSTQSKTSGSISARTGSQTPSSKTMTLSSTRLAAHGESSPPSPKRSRPSECEHGRMSVSPHDRWYYIFFYLFVKPETFAGYAAKITHGLVDEIVFSVGSVDGFYSDWSPSAFASQVKVLTGDREQ